MEEGRGLRLSCRWKRCSLSWMFGGSLGWRLGVERGRKGGKGKKAGPEASVTWSNSLMLKAWVSQSDDKMRGDWGDIPRAGYAMFEGGYAG
jgi:hypothetical protein